MTTISDITLAPPRLDAHGPRQLAGLVQRHDCQKPEGIPNQWRRFSAYLERGIEAQAGHTAYGVCYNFEEDGCFDYLCGVQINTSCALPAGLVTLQIPPQTYAIFTHAGHVAGIRSTMNAIWSQWLPASGKKAVEAPLLEVYGPQFNPLTGLGGFEVWLPIDDAS